MAKRHAKERLGDEPAKAIEGAEVALGDMKPGERVVPFVGGPELVVVEAEPAPPAPTGLALVSVAGGKYLVVRGRLVDFESLTPMRHGEHTGESVHAAPFIGAVSSPTLTSFVVVSRSILRQLSPPQPCVQMALFRKDACLPREIQTVGPCSSASTVAARAIWLESHTVPSCAAAYQ